MLIFDSYFDRYLLQLTMSMYLAQNLFLVVGIYTVRCFTIFVGSVQQPTVPRVTKQQLGDPLTSSSQGDV